MSAPIEIDYLGGLDIPGFFARKKYDENLFGSLSKITVKKIYYRPFGARALWKLSIWSLGIDQIIFYTIQVWFKAKSKVWHIASQDTGYLLNFFKKKATVITVFDLLPFKKPAFLGKIYQRYLDWVMAGIKKANKIVTISEYVKRDICQTLKIPEAAVAVVYPAIDHEIYKPDTERESLKRWLETNYKIQSDFILYVGSEQKRKNFDGLIRCFAEISDKFPSLKLVKVGSPQSLGARANVLNLIQSLRLEQKVIFIEEIAENDLPKFYQAAKMLIFLSKDEGFGLPVLEAMACGCPVVCSNTSSLPEVAGGACSLVDPESRDQVVEMATKIMKENKFRELLISKGISRAKSFSWQNSAKVLEKIYQTIED